MKSEDCRKLKSDSDFLQSFALYIMRKICNGSILAVMHCLVDTCSFEYCVNPWIFIAVKG